MAELHRQMQNLIGQNDLLVQRYRIGRRIGAGAYGMIFRAIDEQNGESVAIKAIPPQARQKSSTAIERFQREMKVIRSLNHPNIISLYDWGRTDAGLIFMVLEFIDGETLDSVVRGAPMEPAAAMDTTRQLAAALHVAHEAGVIHRDLKPANVMLTPRRRGGYGVKVLDFGMAKVLSPLEDESSIIDLTSEGMAVGTPRYIAPEQARGLQVGPATDLYAVGLLMYEMLTGMQAVEADSVKEAVTAHVSSEPLALPALQQIPDVLHPVLGRLLDKDPDRRVQSGRQLVQWLNDLEDSPPSSPVGTQGPAGGGGRGGFHQSSALSQIEPKMMDGDLELESTPATEQKEDDDERPAANSGTRREDMHLRRDHWFRLPRTTGEWVEGAISVGLIPAAFLAVGAQASDWELWARVLIASSPPLVALGLALIRDSAVWGESFGRLCWICCAMAIVVAHLVGPRQLATALVLDPIWFLEPVEGLPGVATVETVVRWVSSQWADILLELGVGRG